MLYRCSLGQYRVKECPAAVQLLYHSTSDRVSLFEADNEHANHVSEQSRGLSEEVEQFIKEKFEEVQEKPNTILHLIRRKKLSEPAKTKL